MYPVVEKFIATKSLDLIVKNITKLINTDKSKYIISKQNLEDALSHHMTQVENWSSEIAFKDLEHAKSTSKVYTVLDLYLTPNRQKLSRGADDSIISIQELLRTVNKHLIILGQPGAGKTTSMKYICHIMLHEEGFSADLNFPIVIRLRELVRNQESESLIQAIFETLGLQIIIENTKSNSDTQRKKIEKSEIHLYSSVINRIVATLLEELGVCLILDGLDEVPDKLRDEIISEVKSLCLSLNRAKIIMTSRLGEFHYSIDNSGVFQICDLNSAQIENFADKWLEEKNSEQFLNELKKSPFKDTAIRPLILAHLLAIYEREKQIPEKPKTVYRKIINLYLEEWDLQRAIVRKSRYGNFEVDRKQEFLANMAYYLTRTYSKTIFSKNEFEAAYKAICENFDLPKFESKKVVEEIESHNGLLIQSGYDAYEFAHKSLQEYLTADYIVKLPFIPIDAEMEYLPNELALSMALSSNPTNYFATIVFQLFSHYDFGGTFIAQMFERIVGEKTDFNQHPIFGTAFLQIFTNQLNSKKLDYEYTLNNFTNFFNQTALKLSLIKMNQYYKIIGNFEGRHDIYIIEKQRHFDNQITVNTPKQLYAHSNFLLNWD